MSKFLLLLIVFFVDDLALAAPYSREQFKNKFHLTIGNQAEQEAIQACLTNWGKHPFKKGAKPRFRVLNNTVRVMGMGSAQIVDKVETDYPQLVLVSASVNILTSTHFRLLNPHGWYCLKANVTILSKSTIKLHCKANLTTSGGNVTIAGQSDSKEKSGLTILGRTSVERIGCSSSPN